MWQMWQTIFIKYRSDVITGGILLLTGLLLFTPMMQRWSHMLESDYEVHNQLAVQVVEAPAEFFRNTPHFLYHVSTALSYVMLPGRNQDAAGAITMILSYLALMMLIYGQLRRMTRRARHVLAFFIAALLTVMLLLVTPITFFTPQNHYFGYFTPHVYHNPTINLMKPFAVLLFFAALPIFYDKSALSLRWIPAYALLTGLCLLAKPSFILAFVPALGLFTLIPLLRRQAIHWPVLLGGIVLPAILILAYQTLTWTSGGGIGIDPLRVFHEWTLHYEVNADKQLIFKLLLSITFPLSAYLLYLRNSTQNTMFNLAWLIFFVSAAMAYLLVDYTVIAAGDFGWGAQAGVLVLFIAAAAFLVQQNHAFILNGGKMRWHHWLRLAICLLLLLLHFVSGLHWYYLHLTQSSLDLLYTWW